MMPGEYLMRLLHKCVRYNYQLLRITVTFIINGIMYCYRRWKVARLIY